VAYGVHRDLVVGGPSWIDHDRYDVVAKASPNTPISRLRLMLQTLLVERFHLLIHREDKIMPVSELAVAKTGPSSGPHLILAHPVVAGAPLMAV
jgi:uncharacterized protein (TIGR03435 family)